MSLGKKQIFREVLNAAKAFYGLRLWEKWANHECFGVRTPGIEHPMFASIMGQGGQEFGLLLLCGPTALHDLRAMLNRPDGARNVTDNASIIAFSMSSRAEVPDTYGKFLRKAGLDYWPEATVPCLLVSEPGSRARELNAKEGEALLFVLRGAMKAHARGELNPQPIVDTNEFLMLTVVGAPVHPEVTVSVENVKESPPPEKTALPVKSAPFRVPTDIATLPQVSKRWLATLSPIPVALREYDQSVSLLLVVDEATTLILKAEMIMGADLNRAAESLCDIFQGDNSIKQVGRPREIAFANQNLFDLLAPGLKPAGIRCLFTHRIPVLEAIVKDFVASLQREHAGGSAKAEMQEREADTQTMPAPDDLGGWKAVDTAVIHRLQRQYPAEWMAQTRIVSKYFGSREDASECFDEFRDRLVEMCFTEWFWLYYRSSAKSTPAAKTLLAGKLPEAERRVLTARVQSHPSIYLAVRVNKGKSIVFRDVIFGGEVEVFDKGLSQSLPENIAMPMQVFPAGQFHFCIPLGPALTSLQVLGAIKFLELNGMELSRSGVAEKSHLFGHLWMWTLETQTNEGPELRNMDNDPMHFHTLTYRVTDANGVSKALRARRDIDYDPDGDLYRWYRDAKKEDGPVGEIITLGRIHFLADRLIVEVNSERRYTRARAWLDTLPGLAFDGVRKQTVEEMRIAKLPPDDRGTQPETLPPEMAAHLREMLRQHYIEWLDTSLPMFGGKTPRQMCRTEAGRRSVAMTIRSMPKPMSQPGTGEVDVPRQEMLRALGLPEREGDR